MKVWLMIPVIVAAMVLPGSEAAAPAGSGKQVSHVQKMMQRKLVDMNGILAGMVRADYASVKKHSRDLADIAVSNSWHKLGNKDFLYYNNNFLQFAQRLAVLADLKDRDDMNLEYLQLTTACFQCHKHVRDK